MMKPSLVEFSQHSAKLFDTDSKFKKNDWTVTARLHRKATGLIAASRSNELRKTEKTGML